MERFVGYPVCPMTTLSRLLAGLSLAVAATGALAQTPTGPNTGLPIVDLTIGMYKVHTEVAATQQARETGLMFRPSMPDTAGMLFVFDESARHCFWMKNTDLPLSIAFIDDNGVITDIAEMKPQTEDNHCPTRPGLYALEMNKGWFTRKGIKVGTKVGSLPR
ncbi:putative lipoprotein [Ralstonia solanacearum CFBP2957]|nr:putative lipoprotein [Ralstonia solanacearum CFBP2957]